MPTTLFTCAIVVCLAILGNGASPDLPDGIYVVKPDGAGTRRKDSDGKELILGDCLGGKWKEARLWSIRNDNSVYKLELNDLGPLDYSRGTGKIALILDGVCLNFAGGRYNPDGKVRDPFFVVSGEDNANKVAKRLGIQPMLRKHPGHSIELRWFPEHDSFEVGEPVLLTMKLRNCGTQPFAFVNGGKQRAKRDGQFRFLAQSQAGHGKSLADEGQANEMGGISSIWTLQPGETLSRTVTLSKWFEFKEPGTYRITGLFEMELKKLPADKSDIPIWDDLPAGECLIRIVPKPKTSTTPGHK